MLVRHVRLERTKGKKKMVAVYRQKAEWRTILKMAAKSWHDGVPWEEALKIAKHVAEKSAKQKGKRAGHGA